MKRISIRWRVALWNTAAFAVVLCGFGILVYSLLSQTHYDQIDRILESRAREIVGDDRLQENPQQRFQFWVRKFGKHVEISGIVRDEQGTTIAEAQQLAEVPELVIPGGVSERPQFDSLALPTLGRMRRLTVSVPTGEGPHTLMLLAELEHMDEELALVISTLLLTIPVTLLLAAGLAYLLAFKALAPVDQLRQMTDEITAERLDRRLPVPNPEDELGHLAQTINSMIARLERSFAEIRRFTADASHELRTPVAVIRSEAEMGADLFGDIDEARSRFQSILEECTRLTSATSQLLTLSRDDAGVTQSVEEHVSIGVLLEEVVDTMRPLAQDKQQTLTVGNIDPKAAVLADPERLRQVFHNLVDNAIKYTQSGGTIRLACHREDDEVVAEVQDNGIGIPEEHVSKIFDRFYRVTKETASSAGGAGLGLSIVHNIVAKLGGRVDVESKPGEGSLFRVFLPLAGES